MSLISGVSFIVADGTAPVAPAIVTSPVSNSTYGQSLLVVAGVTAVPISILSTTDRFQIVGFIAGGTGDGYFVLRVNNVTQVTGRIMSTAPMLQIILPNGIAPAIGSIVTISVTNESGSTADYDVTLLGF